jgi:hypothetical protein
VSRMAPGRRVQEIPLTKCPALRLTRHSRT